MRIKFGVCLGVIAMAISAGEVKAQAPSVTITGAQTTVAVLQRVETPTAWANCAGIVKIEAQMVTLNPATGQWTTVIGTSTLNTFVANGAAPKLPCDPAAAQPKNTLVKIRITAHNNVGPIPGATVLSPQVALP